MLKRISMASLVLALGVLPQAFAQGQVIADSGFRPKPNGFAFENWGGQKYPYSKITPDDAALLFGDQACARKQGDTCVPTPGAKMWIEQMNKSTEGGHCEGMAALSAAFFVKQETVDEFGAKQPFALKPDDEWLMRTISTYYSTQALDPVQSATSATRKWSLQQIVDQLAKSMKAGNDYPTLGIYDQGGGHAITPYKIELTAPKQYRIYIYDNNYPGAERFIDVDTGNNRWIYTGAALNPAEAASAWKGSAGAMDVTLLSTRYEPLKCPFCGAPPPQQKPPKPKPPTGPKPTGPKPSKAPPPGSKPKPKPKPPKPQAAAPKPKPPASQGWGPSSVPTSQRPPAQPSQTWTVYTPSRCSQVQATGKKTQKQVKMGANGVDSQINGASMQPMRGTRGCVVQLPRDQEYDVKLVDDGKPSSQPLTALTVFSPGQVYSVSNVAIRPNAAETISFSPTNFNYQAGSAQKPTVRVADENYGGDGYYEVSDFEINEGHNFTAEEDASGRIAFSDDDPELDDYDIDVEVVGDDETEYYEFDDVSTGDDGEVLLEVDDEGDLDMDVDSDGDGEGNYYDEDDDNDGSDDAADSDDDNDGTSDETDDNYVGEEDYEYDDDGADADAGDDAADAAEDDSDEGDAADESEDQGDDEGDVSAKSSASDDDDAEDAADESADEAVDESEDEAAYEDEAADESADEATDEDEAVDESEDEAAYEDEAADESADEATYEDEAADESEDEAAYEDEAVDESEDAGYDEDDSSEDE